MISTHADTFTHDDEDLLIDAVEAEYEIDAVWGRRDARGYRSVDYVNSVTLISWGKARRDRDQLVQMIGEPAVQAEEQRIADSWLESAVQDEADEYADQMRDLRMAAE